MRRAVLLISILSVLAVGLGLWVDLEQRQVAREYMDGVGMVRWLMDQGEIEKAAQEQAYLHAQWQHDAKWLNCLISHHHTRAVTTAMIELAAALENRWDDEILRALDKAEDALSDIEGSDFCTLENIL